MSEHWIYVMREEGTGALKIGKCSKPDNIQSRKKELQTGCPFEISLIATFAPGEHPGESVIHNQLSDYRIRPQGEWFVGVKAVYRHLGIPCDTTEFNPETAYSAHFSARLAEIYALTESALHLHEEAKLRVFGQKQKEIAERSHAARDRQTIVESIARDLARHPDERFSQQWREHSFLQSNDFIMELVKSAMHKRWSGKDLRRFLLVEASFGLIEGYNPYAHESSSVKDALLAMFDWLRIHDPELLDEAVAALNKAIANSHETCDAA